MKQRNISKEEVETCVNNPETTYPSNDDRDCINYIRTFANDRRIRVVLREKNPEHKVVISVMEQGELK